MNQLQLELLETQKKLNNTAFQTDYPDIDNTIDFRDDDYYIQENTDDYIQKTLNEKPVVISNDDFVHSSLTDPNNPLEYPVVLNKSQQKEIADSVKQNYKEYKLSNDFKKMGFYELLQKISLSLLEILEDLTSNKLDKNYIQIFTKDYRLLAISILILVISVFINLI